MIAGPYQTSIRPAYDYILSIEADGYDYNVRDEIDALGYDGSDPVTVLVTVASGYKLGASSTAAYALDTGAMPAGSRVYLVIEDGATIAGHGGDGGNNGGGINAGGSPGEDGGDAIRARVPVVVYNYGIAGSGGGGGGGGNDAVGNATSPGGGGGAGHDPGLGNGTGATNGSLLTGGTGSDVDGGNGGDGGDLGEDGEDGDAAGGKAGYVAVGNSLIDWRVEGDRRGPVSA